MKAAGHVARLYAVPPPEFTATRNRLAAELRQQGRDDEARSLARLRKPSAALWAVNRLASTESSGLARLFDAVGRLRRSQLADPRAAAEALRAQRAALDALVVQGRAVLARAGLTASPQALRRLSDTLMGAAVDRGHADALRRGALTEELRAPGFDAFSGARVAASPRLRLVRSRSAASPPSHDRQATVARAVEADRRRRFEADDVARQAAARAQELSALEAERRSVRARLAEVDQRLRTARRAAGQAATAAKRARRNAGRT